MTRPDPEVPEKPARRQYTAEYKRRILVEAEQCKSPGDLGALLRREGLYFSYLSSWRRQRERGEIQGLAPKKRGPKKSPPNPLEKRVRELERENRRLEKRLRQAELVIDFQKKLSEILDVPLPKMEDGETGS